MITPAPTPRGFGFSDLLLLVAAVAAVCYAVRELTSLLKTETPPRPRTGWRTSERAGTP